ncbi:dihydrolipoyl dehydrogenase family protein [Tunturibacter empetritectus]|uniref:Pyruvate/2-oxoglutarate dehydrogenase complex dihydrolipoamide dehydrogenase (E3) component n=1 Tax=Tunturiibacter lichenicola TaxID=2051959 RepID=A0A7W8N6I1_9BACT|nr:FAD-dependent oxidoreductase [Edaphobacter lichenicola]MBB5345631.1 pyruvate/2-oxoglutarate dehydrogenase complex dihydrolipoamide dehydrogenase (E3) component [Edaphobacter lichenicola]
MSTPEQYDAIIIGSGEGGKYLAWHLGSQGKKVANIEDKRLGGACPNIACLPSKNVIHSAKVASFFQRGAEFGIVHGDWHVDMEAVSARRQRMIDGLRDMHLANYAKSKAEIVMGFGRFVAEKTVEVALNAGGTRTLRSDYIFLDTGSRATIDPILGLAESTPMTHIELLELTTLPEHLLVLGGGFIGLELAQAMRRFGSNVTIIERNPTLVHREDPDVTQALHQLFADEGIDIVTRANVTRIEGTSGKSVIVHLSDGARLEGTHLLVATGRTPNTQNMNLDLVGIKTTPSGHFQVNDRLETTAPGVWAMGDCAGSPHFTHASFDDFRIVRDNLAGASRTTKNRQIPSVTFTDPELAHVGLTENEAKKQGTAYRLGKIPMAAALRTRTLDETRGFMKVLIGTSAESEDDRILGFTAFGPGAGELLPVIQLAISANLPYTAVHNLILTHPTLSEGFLNLFNTVPKHPA